MFRNLILVLLFPLLIVAGCASAPMGPTSGVAESTVKGSVDDVNQRAQAVFQQMNIKTTGNSMKNDGNERQLMGKVGDTDVTVIMDNENNSTTNVKVQASKNIVSGNKDLAKDILSRIVQRS